MPTPGRKKGPMGAKFFTQFFTHNFDISILHRELTLHAISIHALRPLDYMYMNIWLKSISVNHNITPKLFIKTFLFPTVQVTIQSPQENSPKTTLKAKSLHFSLLFCQKVIFN